MSRKRFSKVADVSSAVTFLLAFFLAGGEARAQPFFLQGLDGQDDTYPSVVNADLTVTGKLTVQGGYDVGNCPSGYEQDPAADPGIIVCVQPTSGDEMVKVGDFWVDRYEATVFDDPDCTGTPLGSTADDWGARAPGFLRNGNWTTKAYSCSVPGQIPSRWITWFQAQAACAASGKRLCTHEEWQAAAQGTYDPGAFDGSAGGGCNTQSAGPRVAGNAGVVPGGTTSCISRWGAEDMIGNLWEWVGLWQGHPGWNGALNIFTAEFGGDGYWAGGAAYTSMPDRGTHASWRPGAGAMIASGGDNLGEYFGPAAVQRGGAWTDGTDAGMFTMGQHNGPAIWNTGLGTRCCRRR